METTRSQENKDTPCRYPFRKRETFHGVKIDIKAKTEEELGRKYQKRIDEIKQGLSSRSSSMTVDSWFDRYMTEFVDKKVSYRTYTKRETQYKKRIKPIIGSKPIGLVKQSDCQAIANDLAGCGKDYIDKTIQLLFSIFKRAKAEKLIYENPAEDLVRPPATNGSGRAASMRERALALLVAPDHRAGLWVRSILYLGFRPGETDRFKGCHINYDAGLVFIDGTKTASAKRIVPCPDELLKDFKALNLGKNDYVFTNTVGNHLTGGSRTVMWHNFVREMNLKAGCSLYRNKLQDPVVAPDFIPYCLRHSFATDLKDANVPYPIRQELLGHSDGSVTDRYTHRTEASLEKARTLLEAFRAEQMKEIKKVQQEIITSGYDLIGNDSEDLTSKFFPGLG